VVADITHTAVGRRWNPTHLPQLDGLRAVAVGLVVIYHVFRAAHGSTLSGGFLGVDVFFVLSGFLITSLLLQEQRESGRIALLAFYRRRFWRLYPCLVLVSLFAATWFLIVPTPDNHEIADAGHDTAYGALFALTYVASWAFAFDWPTGAMGHAWSLSVEEHFYLVWPVLALMVLRRRPAHLLRWTAALTACAALWPAVLRILTDPSRDRLYGGADTRASQLLIGCLLAILLARPQGLGRLRFIASGPALVVAGAVFGMALLTFERRGAVYLTGGQLLISLVAAVVIAHLVTGDSLLTRVLAWRPAVAVGRWSYGIYLWHIPLMIAPYAFLGVTGAARLLGALLSIPLAAASFRFIERPLLQKYGRRPRTDHALPSLVTQRQPADAPAYAAVR
jgi:peptidoglycan/LPS O-acetylase OafA/YrhL